MKYKLVFIISLFFISTAGACTSKPVIPQPSSMPSSAVSMTDSTAVLSTPSPVITNTPKILHMVDPNGTAWWKLDDGKECCWLEGDGPTATPTPWITWTPQPNPDVELSQLQVVDTTVIIAEIVNHMNVPVVFEDMKPAFEFNIYDPVTNKQWDELSQVNRLSPTTIPCVLYPNEHAFFRDATILSDWYSSSEKPDPSQLYISYKSLGVPRTDWTNNSTQLELRNIQWNVEDHLLYFSFNHDPIVNFNQYPHYFGGTIGVFDKGNDLLGVGAGVLDLTAKSGNATGYWISLNHIALGEHMLLGFFYAGQKNIDDKIDHISVLAEFIKSDGFCFKLGKKG